MAPEDEVINPSSLTKFRKLRLKDMNLLDMLIAKTVQLALEKELLSQNPLLWMLRIQNQDTIKRLPVKYSRNNQKNCAVASMRLMKQ